MSARSATLRSKLLRWLLIPLSLLFVVDAIGSYFLARNLSNRVYDGELMEIARELNLHAKVVDGVPTFDLEKDAERTLLLDQYDEVFYAVRAADGALIAGDAELPRGHADAAPVAYDGGAHGNPVRIAQIRGTDHGGTPFTVQVAETLVKRHMLANEILIGVILPQLLLIGIAGLVLWAGVARGLAPLRALQEAVAARSHLDLSPVDVAHVPSEVDPLLCAVNDLMARLDTILTYQSRFIADAAHQLRTPVAGLKAHIEVALREEDPVQARLSLAHLYTAVERMSRLVAQLLSLARNEPATVRKVAFAPIDLSRLAFDVTMEWVPQAYRKHIDLGFEAAQKPATINGDALRLTELMNNLLDNGPAARRRQRRRAGHPGRGAATRVRAFPPAARRARRRQRSRLGDRPRDRAAARCVHRTDRGRGRARQHVYRDVPRARCKPAVIYSKASRKDRDSQP